MCVSMDMYFLFVGDPSIRVHGNLAHDVFDGTIFVGNELYHIEPSRRCVCVCVCVCVWACVCTCMWGCVWMGVCVCVCVLSVCDFGGGGGKYTSPHPHLISVCVCTCNVCVTCTGTLSLSPCRYLRDADHHSVIYRQSDLDLSTISGATCGSVHEDIRKEMLIMQDSVIRDAERFESDRLKRQTSHDPLLVRCWLFALADYKFVTALQSTGDDPVGVMLSIILTVSTCTCTCTVCYCIRY